jgi:aminoglycoside phosphotransferase family enzyme
LKQRQFHDVNLPVQLRDILDRLKKNLLRAFKEYPFQDYFNQRIQDDRIKRCHGDLKAPHIWIAPISRSRFRIDPRTRCFLDEPWKYVYVVDTIDFNSTYCNIDILSDVAMLLIDIQARTQSFELAKLVESYYLILTGQQDKVSRLVLNYYLVEKAIMCSAVSIIYDNFPELGLTFLKIAEERMKYLLVGDLMCRAETLIDIPLLFSTLYSSI